MEADGAIYDPEYWQAPHKVEPGTKKVYHILVDPESTALRKHKGDPKYRSQFDAAATYEVSISEIPMTAFTFQHRPETLYRPIPFGKEHRRGTVTIVAHGYDFGSYLNLSRPVYLTALLPLMNISSYGRAFTNSKIPADSPFRLLNYSAPWGLDNSGGLPYPMNDFVFGRNCIRNCRAEKLMLFTNFKFAFAFENGDKDPDYHTGKG
jgi:hypothetical protein